MSPVHSSAGIFTIEIKDPAVAEFAPKAYIVTKHLFKVRFASLKDAEIWARIGGGAALIEEVEISKEALEIPTLEGKPVRSLNPTEPLSVNECKWCETCLTQAEDSAGWKLCWLCRLDAGV